MQDLLMVMYLSHMQPVQAPSTSSLFLLFRSACVSDFGQFLKCAMDISYSLARTSLSLHSQSATAQTSSRTLAKTALHAIAGRRKGALLQEDQNLFYCSVFADAEEGKKNEAGQICPNAKNIRCSIGQHVMSSSERLVLRLSTHTGSQRDVGKRIKTESK